jgi:type III secretion system FlhB-like substrate exporter
VEIGSCIPPETWAAVAAIFAFLEKGTKEKWFL